MQTLEFRKILEAQAKQRKGKVKGLLFANPILCINYLGLELQFCFVANGSAVKTVMSTRVDVPLDKFVHLYPQKFKGLTLRFGPEVMDLKMNYPEFDEQFIVQSNDRAFLENVISLYIQETLLQNTSWSPSLMIEKGTLKFYVPKILTDKTELDLFIRAAAVLVQEFGELRLQPQS